MAKKLEGTTGGVIPESDRHQTIMGHMDLCRAIAHQMAKVLPRHIRLDDIIGAGCVGLVKGVNTFDGRGTLRGFLGRKIAWAILDFLRKDDFMTQADRTLLKKIEAAMHQLRHTKSANTSDDEISSKVIAEALSVDAEKVSRLQSGIQIVSLDEDADIIDADSGSPFHEDFFARRELWHKVEAVLNNGILNKREKYVIRNCVMGGTTLDAAKNIFGVSAARMTQIKKAALRKLRQVLAGEFGADEMETLAA